MKVPLTRPAMDKEMVEAAVQALQNERLVMGESVLKFEEAFARYCGAKYGVSVSSGTHALHFAFEALGIKGTDEVVTSPTSFVASANTVMHARATPTFCDIDRATWNLDPAKLSARLTSRTKAVLPVHIFGRPADVPKIRELCDKKGIVVVEDACQAHGAEVGGKRAGALGKVGCFSFYPTKNMTVGGDGGMVTTDDEKLATDIRKLRDCGRMSRYEHDVLGYTARLNTVNAAIGLVQLKRLPAWTEARIKVADRYRRRLSDVRGVTLPAPDPPGTKNVYHLFSVRVSRRDEAAKFLGERGIETGNHYPIPIHLQPLYRRLFGTKEGTFPEAEAHAKEALSLPIYPGMPEAEQDHVVASLRAFFGG
ncbi:MAG: DegT/DnrJ/EryC1/StrS family aminotransferase [Methanobacteriota archaeon]